MKDTSQDKKKGVEREELTKIGEEKESIDTEYELFGKLARVHSNIKDIVSEDYILGDMKEAEKTFVKETVNNAKYAKDIIIKYMNGYSYEWDNEKKDWVRDGDGDFKKIYLSESKMKEIEELSNEAFANCMLEPHVTAILSRNKDTNFILGLLGGNALAKKEEKKVEEKSTIEKIKAWAKGDDGDESEDGD